MPQIDLSPIREFNLKLCLSKEWYRFPSHYLIPNGIRVDFVKSEFSGALPRHFDDEGGNYAAEGQILKWWFRPQTRTIPSDLNDLNLEDMSRYVSADQTNNSCS